MTARVLFASQTAAMVGPNRSLEVLLSHAGGMIDATVVFAEDGPFRERFERRGIPVLTIGSRTKRSIPMAVGLMARGQYSLLYTNETSRFSRNLSIAAMMTSTPFATHVRSMGWQLGSRRLAHLSKAEDVVAVSSACAESVERFVRPGKLHVVHNGVDLDDFRPIPADERRAVRREIDIPPAAPVVISVAHVTPRKGQLASIEMLRRVSEASPAVHLAIVGSLERDPEYTNRVASAANALGLSSRVRWLGLRQDVDRLLGAADLFLHTATADPHPRSVIEAMAVGLPVVAYAADGVCETVVDGETGYLASVGDLSGLVLGVENLLGSRERAASMGAAGRCRAEELFSARASGIKVRGIIERALA